MLQRTLLRYVLIHMLLRRLHLLALLLLLTPSIATAEAPAAWWGWGYAAWPIQTADIPNEDRSRGAGFFASADWDGPWSSEGDVSVSPTVRVGRISTAGSVDITHIEAPDGYVNHQVELPPPIRVPSGEERVTHAEWWVLQPQDRDRDRGTLHVGSGSGIGSDALVRGMFGNFIYGPVHGNVITDPRDNGTGFLPSAEHLKSLQRTGSFVESTPFGRVTCTDTIGDDGTRVVRVMLSAGPGDQDRLDGGLLPSEQEEGGGKVLRLERVEAEYVIDGWADVGGVAVPAGGTFRRCFDYGEDGWLEMLSRTTRTNVRAATEADVERIRAEALAEIPLGEAVFVGDGFGVGRGGDFVWGGEGPVPILEPGELAPR